MSCATVHPSPTRAHAVPVPTAVRTHRRSVARWAISNGRSAHRDALAAIVATRAATLSDPAGVCSPTVWTSEEIEELLWVGVADWCEAAGVDPIDPVDIAATLDTYLRHLSARRLIAVGSDPLASLRRAVVDHGRPRSTSHPTLSRRRLAPVVPIA